MEANFYRFSKSKNTYGKVERQMTSVLDDILQGFICEDDSNEITACRFVNYLKEMTSGREFNEESLLKLISEDKVKSGVPMIVCRDNIKFSAMCPHHLLPYFGTVSIKLKAKRFCGISKLDRLVNIISKKALTQEDMTDYIGNILLDKGVIYVQVVIKAVHTCASCRGIESEGEYTTIFDSKERRSF